MTSSGIPSPGEPPARDGCPGQPVIPTSPATAAAMSGRRGPHIAWAAEVESLSDPLPTPPGTSATAASGAAAGTPARPRLDAGVFVRGVAALMISQGFTWISTAVITFTLPRFLGSANLGRYSFAVAVFGLAELGADLGIGTYLNRQVARDTASAPRLLSAALASRLVLGAAAAAVLFAGFNLFSSDPVIRLTVDGLCINVVVDTLALAGVTLNG